VIKLRKIKLEKHVARIGTGKVCKGFWCGNLRKRDNLKAPGLGERIILRWVFRKWDVRAWTGSSWRRIGTSGGHMNAVMNLRDS
jgi:hypothetical protein